MGKDELSWVLLLVTLGALLLWVAQLGGFMVIGADVIEDAWSRSAMFGMSALSVGSFVAVLIPSLAAYTRARTPASRAAAALLSVGLGGLALLLAPLVLFLAFLAMLPANFMGGGGGC